MSGSRDRFFAAVRHERPDRVPLDLWARPEIRRRLQEYLATDDVESALGVDFARVAIRECVPEFERTSGMSGMMTGPLRMPGALFTVLARMAS